MGTGAGIGAGFPPKSAPTCIAFALLPLLSPFVPVSGMCPLTYPESRHLTMKARIRGAYVRLWRLRNDLFDQPD
ncbi:MAG: hypothetical protein RLP44_17985 [Aggregatilineales bacterium]